MLKKSKVRALFCMQYHACTPSVSFGSCSTVAFNCSSLGHLSMCCAAFCVTADAYSSTKDALKKIRNLHKFAKTLRDASKRDAVTQRLKPIEEALQHSSALKFATGSGYIRFMLGHVNVKVFTVTEKNMLRDEYNKFRDRTNIIFFVVPIFISVLHEVFQARFHC
eukprot:INCI15753.2.p2 GENE.INCI15753.2~~INCI15753.2.p2  ORF type:complete len:165 (-),score=31.71 INCI15753.2:1004-1498(-)